MTAGLVIGHPRRVVLATVERTSKCCWALAAYLLRARLGAIVCRTLIV